MKVENEKLIQEWKNKIHDSFGDKGNLYRYLFETLDNFYYRYIETSLSKNLHTEELAPKIYGARSFETMFEALKTARPELKQELINLAKSNKDAQVRYGMWVEIEELDQDFGKMKIVSEINWDFPLYQDQKKGLRKVVKFEYQELAVFRKQLALKLEEASEIF